MEKLKICILASGNLGFTLLKYLYKREDLIIHSVFTNKKSEEIVTFCEEFTIPCFAGNPRNGKSLEFRSHLKTRPDVILSINYLFLIEDDLISYPLKYAINVHGSLLPKYRGRTPHVWSIINGEKETGITAHFITSGCDKGDIVVQNIIPITNCDTGGSVLKKHNEAYPVLIDEIIHMIQMIQSENIKAVKQDESKATYYPKRTPEDGEINWDWLKERIYNWVRAMAPPEYLGAFFYNKSRKIIVQKAEFTDIGFPENCLNGSILTQNKNEYFIKVQNGVLKITEFVN